MKNKMLILLSTLTLTTSAFANVCSSEEDHLLSKAVVPGYYVLNCGSELGASQKILVKNLFHNGIIYKNYTLSFCTDHVSRKIQIFLVNDTETDNTLPPTFLAICDNAFVANPN